MKKLIISSVLASLCALTAWAGPQPQRKALRTADDTVVINFGKSRITLVLATKADREKLKELDLNQLLSKVDGYIAVASQSKRDTVFTDKNTQYEINVADSSLIVVRQKPADAQKQNEESKEKEKQKDRDKDRRRSRKVIIDVFDLDLGLNTYFGSGGTPSGQPYELRPLGSRYVAMSSGIKVPLGKSPVKLRTGLELSWYNFMFANNVRVENQPSGVAFVPANIDLDRSKLTAAYLNLPVMFEIGRSYNTLALGLGGYVGYRLGSYTKEVYYESSGDKQKPKNHENFALSDLRYGLTTQLRVYRLTLFFNYDLNPLFAQGRGPELNAFSFGVRL